MTSPIDPEFLLRENAWLQRLATSLTGPDGAADLAQDAWVAALEHPARASGDGARAWMVAVARNLVRLGLRRRANERAREREVARAEALPSVLESVERVAAQRELVDEVLALEPLERDLVVLRYFEDLPPRVIAERLGLSSSAVRSRLARALGQLRERLDRRFEGGRTTWAGLLVPPRRIQPPTRTSGPATPSLPIWLAALAASGVVVVATVRVLASSGEDAESAARLAYEAEPASLALEPEPLARATPAPVQVAAARRTAVEPVAALTSSTWTLVARFVDGNGAPLAGVRLASLDTWSAASDLAGEVRVELSWPYTGQLAGNEKLWVEASGAALATRGWYVTPMGPGEQALGEIPMQPGGSIAGRIVDEEGRPVAEAFATATGGYEPRTAAGLEEARTFGSNVLRLGPNLRAQTRSASDGRFALDGVLAGDIVVQALAGGRLSGFSATASVLPGQRVDVGDVVLARPGPENQITGRVRDALGQLVPEAHIEFGERDPRRTDGWQARADADGRFALLVPRDRRFMLAFSRDERGLDPLVVTDVPSGTRDLDVRLLAERWVEVVALDAQQELAPISSLQVWNASGEALPVSNEPQPDGTWSLRLPDEPFEVHVTTPGWKNLPQGPLDPASVGDRLVFPVERAAGMSGRVLADGAPVAGARVHAHPHWEGDACGVSEGFLARVHPLPFAETRTAADGRFWIPGDSSGTVTLHAELDGWPRAELGPIEFVDGLDLDGLDLVLEPGGAIEGRLLAAPGVEVRGKVVGVGCGEAHVTFQELEADGAFRFENLRPGDYQVRTARPEYVERVLGGTYDWADPAKPVEWNATVRAGEVTYVELDQRDRIPARLAGELRFAGQPVARGSVMLSNEDTDHEFTAIASGRFQLRVSQPGSFRLYLYLEAGPASVRLDQRLDLQGGDNTWACDLPVGTLTLTNVPAFEPSGPQEAPAYGLRWRDDPALSWRAGLHRPPEAGSSALTIPNVPAGRVQVLRRPDGQRVGGPDESWTVLLELDLLAGAHATARLP